MGDPVMRGFFYVGAEAISKAMNLGALIRTAHAFGAAGVFLIDVHYTARAAVADTSRADHQLPLFEFTGVDALVLPKGAVLVGIELTPDAVDLPSFRHPLAAAYVLGSERGVLSPALQARCAYIVRIPTRFCVNLAVAGAIVMYDRMVSLGRFAERPVRSGGPVEPRAEHVHGRPTLRRAG
jgi:tRNA G18 (ribose-2'-O)-methylase SpoU